MTATPGGNDSAAVLDRRFDESNKPRTILWSGCPTCGHGSWFRSIKRDERRNKAPEPFVDTDGHGKVITGRLVKVKGRCMICQTYSEFHTDDYELATNRYSPKTGDLCLCGFPAFHADPPAHLRRSLNVTPLPCRPSRNGHSDT